MIPKAKKPTALEAALNDSPLKKLDWRVFALVGGILLLMLAGICSQHFLQLMRERAAESTVKAQAEWLAGTVSEVVMQQRALAIPAVERPEVRQAFPMLDEAARQRAEVALREQVPGLVSVDLMGSDLGTLISEDFETYGYTKAKLLMATRALKEAPPAEALGATPEDRLMLHAVPIRDGDKLLGVAVLGLPYAPIEALVDQVNTAGGYIELSQGEPRGLQWPLSQRGQRSMDKVATTYEATGSMMRAVAVPPQLFRLPPFDFEGPWTALAGLVVFTLLGGGLLALRRGAHHKVIAKVAQRRKTEDEPQMTLAEATRAAAAGDAASPKPKVPTKPVGTPARRAELAGSAAHSGAVDRSMFRAYDIRGIVGKGLTAGSAKLIGQAVGSRIIEKGLREVVVARDGRLSGPELSQALIAGLRAAGCDVIDIGAVPTPVLYFATYHLNTGSGVMVTGSHNPPEYNGFKIVVGGETLAEDAIQDLYARIAENRLATGEGGLQVMDLKDDYIERIANDIQLENPIKVVVDSGNGIPGIIGPELLAAIGCEVIPLYCDVDGNFPNHHPDPSDPHNLQDLITSVQSLGAHIGIAFDGDGDRLGVVTPAGEIIFPDRLLMLFAIDVLSRNPGANIIYDVKCTGHLAKVILGHGGSPIMWKTGHSLIKGKMRETEAELAGEMSGHFFFRERWYGFDDGIYSAARLMEIIATDGRPVEEIFAELPSGVSTPELKIQMKEGDHYRFIERFREKATFDGARITNIDGVRADYPDGWGLVRCSNTTPCLVLRFDADTDEALLRIQDVFRKQILGVDPSLSLPF